MSKKSKRKSSVLQNENTDYAAAPADKVGTADYLGFASNGMTDNERIDDFDYYDEFISDNR